MQYGKMTKIDDMTSQIVNHDHNSIVGTNAMEWIQKLMDISMAKLHREGEMDIMLLANIAKRCC